MPSSKLYAINNEGRVFSLCTTGSMWREFMYLGLEFKQLSAVPHFMWAIGGDRQVYVHVHGLDIPIRIKEETYENERWLPLEGFSGRLLPTDRYHFSNQDGTVDRSRDKVKLPSMAWQWEGDWHIETTLDGQPLDHDGWTYALDFPATYTTSKKWKSCVRRRKWVRYRRYSAMNSWCAIAPLHKDATKEPFTDVSIGGNQIPGGNPGALIVWAVTAYGRVMFRVGVSTTSPEGQRWSAIKLPSGNEALQITVGVTGLVWLTLLNGKALIRTGVTRENPMGDEWVEVDPPQSNLRLIQISVGLDSVWAVTHEGSVWFRKGIKGEMGGMCEQLAVGTGWVEMSTKMILVSVASNDQVWAIGYEDRYLYYRTGITRSELTGKKWKLINAPFELSRASSNASLSSSNRHSICGTPQQQRNQAYGSLQNQRPVSTNETLIREWEEQSRSAPTPTSLKLIQKNSELPENNIQKHIKKEILQKENTNSIGSLEANDLNNSVANITISNETLNKSGESIVVSGKGMSSTIKVNPGSWSPVHSVGSMVGTEAHPETDGCIFDPDLTGDSGVFGEDESTAAVYWAECEMLWCKVEAGACLLDINNPPKWVVDGNAFSQGETAEPWRMHILNELKSRIKEIDFDISLCEKAIEKSSWVKNGEAKCKLKGSSTYEDCIIELEWISSDSGSLDSGTLTILNPDGATTMVQFPISEITCVVCCSEPGNPRLAIHTPHLNNLKISRLQFGSDTELEDWIAHLTSVSCQINSAYGKPSSKAIWATTALGDVFVYDPLLTKDNQYLNGFYIQELDTLGKNLPFESILQNGFPSGSSLQISACIHDDADRISLNFVCHSTSMNKYKQCIDSNDVAFHFNPRLNENIIIRNTYQNNQWDVEDRNGESPLTAGSDFTLLINCEDRGYRVFINNSEFTYYCHKIPPQNITHLRIKGKITLCNVLYKSKHVIIEPISIFWRQIGGHQRKVETCNAGVTWGIGYDNTAWVYTGGWGGTFLKGLNFSTSGVNPMIDTHNYFVYENQRWNPVTGYTSHGLPTDRYMWSDATGRHKRTRENTKLLSCHWQWVSEWILDFHTPGGVDRDGWQYATDFPSQYHGKKKMTDLVRRRRWFRRCQLTSSGPWKELGNTKLVDVSLYNSENPESESPIHVWAVAANGEALFRRGVSAFCPTGVSWEHIPSDQALVSISIGPNEQVWAIGKNGSSYWRFGISRTKPTGECWQNVEPPSGAHLKQIAVGTNVVWVLDTLGRLSVRRGIQSNIFAEGTYWQTLPAMAIDPIHIDVSVVNAKQGFRHVSVGHVPRQVWAISGAGIVCRRIGITDENPAGSGWATGIGIKEDMENYMRYMMFGGCIKMKKDVVPHIFDCEPDRRPAASSNPRSGYVKLNRKREITEMLINNCCSDENVAKNFQENTTNTTKYNKFTKKSETVNDVSVVTDNNINSCENNFNLPTVEQTVCDIPALNENRRVLSFGEINVHSFVPKVEKKHFRSKSILCLPNTYNAESQTETMMANKCCSPITITKESTSSVSAILSSEGNKTTSSSEYQPSLNDIVDVAEDKILEEKRAALRLTNYIISMNTKNYIGIPKDWLWIVDELSRHTGISTDNIKLTLMIIKLNDSFVRLGDQFGLCRSSASKIFNSSVPKLAHMLKTFIYSPDKKSLKKSLPISFRANLSHVFGIIDAFEVQIEKPSDSTEQSLTWSDYKKCNTLKYLICISCDDLTMFMSCGYGGRISDTELFQNCGIMDIIPEKSVIMADRGFKQIDTILNKKHCDLIRPPSVSANVKPTKAEVLLTKRIASLRIHVERVIRRIREFSLLEPHSTLNHAIMPYIDDIVTIAAALINLQGPVIKT